MDNSTYASWYKNFRIRLDKIGGYFEEDDISLNTLEIISSTIKLWEKDIYEILQFARTMSLSHLHMRNDISNIHRNLIDLYKNKKSTPIVARPDTIIVKGIPKILELNYDSSSIEGIFEIDYIQTLFLNSPFEINPTTEFLSGQTEFTNFIISIFAEISEVESNKTMGLLIYNNMSQYDKDIANSISKWINNNTDIKCFVKMHETLYVENNIVTDGENYFDLLYIYSTLIDVSENTRFLENLILQSANTKSMYVSDPKDLAVDCKLGLALLYESAVNKNSDIPDYLHKLIKKYIPWTITVKDGKGVIYHGSNYNLKELLISRQKDFVLKRTNSFYGKHVIMGCKVNFEVWSEVLERILKSNNEIWIAQEYLISDKYNFLYFDSKNETLFFENRHYVLSPYFLGNKISSFLVRVEKNKKLPLLSRHTDGNMGIALVKSTGPSLIKKS